MDAIDNGYLAPPQYSPSDIPDLIRRIWELETELAAALDRAFMLEHEAGYLTYRLWLAER